LAEGLALNDIETTRTVIIAALRKRLEAGEADDQI
jgi:hypothetical protein